MTDPGGDPGLAVSASSVEVGVVRTAQAPEPCEAQPMTSSSMSSPTPPTEDETPVSPQASDWSEDIASDVGDDLKVSAEKDENDGKGEEDGEDVEDRAEDEDGGGQDWSPPGGHTCVRCGLDQTTCCRCNLGNLDGEDSEAGGGGVSLCCCYRAVSRGFLRCLEETPAMLPGLLLTLLFTVTIIILIPTTGRVRWGERVCVCVVFGVCVCLCVCVCVCVSVCL